MKNFNNWKNMSEGVENPETEKVFSTDRGTKMNMSQVINMIAYSIDTINNSNNDNSNIKPGNYYLYKNKKGETYPVRVLSLDYNMEKDKDNTFKPGRKDLEKKQLGQKNVDVQYTNTNNVGSDGIITGTKSRDIAVFKNRLEPIDDKEIWPNDDIDDLINQYNSENNEKRKKMISLYIQKQLKEMDIKELDVILKNSKFENYKDFIEKIINSKKSNA